ncbi:MAG: AraC family transcriptional regulator [Clostridia bacterium]|nr:AraC family transcriptional regulator [Clostridia bacterium]
MNSISYVGRQMRTYNVSVHSHDEWEVIYCTSGQGEYVINESEIIKYKAGDAIAIPPHVRHQNRSDEGFSNIYLNIADATIPYKSVKKISDEQEQQIYRTFSEAFFYFNADMKNKELVLAALGMLIVSYLIVYVGKNETSEVVEEIKKAILKNFADVNFRLDVYMKTLPFSYEYLRKLFKKETGVTPHEYLMRTRMNAAQLLLSGSSRFNYSINETSEMCGFSEPLYFSRVFKKRIGVSPSQFVHLGVKSGNDAD